MTLVIREQFWSVEEPTIITNKVEVPLIPGKVSGMERYGMHFTIDAITDEGVCVSVRYRNQRYNQTWMVTHQQGIYYRPVSMDGGYEYFIDLKGE